MKAQDIISAKKAIRQRVLALRDAMSGDARAQKSAAITAKLLALAQFAAADVVAAYVGFGTELDTGAFVQAALTRGKRLLLPRVDRDTREMHFHVVSDLQNQLLPGVVMAAPTRHQQRPDRLVDFRFACRFRKGDLLTKCWSDEKQD